MSALDPGEFRKLTACLSRLASPHDGEIVAAASAAGRILEKMGLGFGDLTIASALPPPEPRRRTRGERCRPQSQFGHQAKAYALLNCGHEWNDWSVKFLASIVGWNGRLSEKQAATLASLDVDARDYLARRRAG